MDGSDTQLKSSDSSEVYTVTDTQFSSGGQTTTLAISGTELKTDYTCNFVIDEVVSNRY